MDFSEEVQSGYFDQRQVSLHPMMAYYRYEDADENEESRPFLVKHAIIGVSPDVQHDNILVKAFEDQAIDLLRKQPELDLKRIIEWTDGCAAQYKCKYSFTDVSQRSSSFQVERNYFETSHGKSPCDGLGSVVKNSCYRAVVTGRALLPDATAILKYCQEKLAHGPQLKGDNEISKWDFVYVAVVNHERSQEEKKLPTVKGTQKLHSIQGTGTPLEIRTRFLSCYYDPCKQRSGSCDNNKWVDSWSTSQLGAADNSKSKRGKYYCS